MSSIRLLLILLAILSTFAAAVIPLILRRFGRQTGFDFQAPRGGAVIASDVGVGLAITLRDERLGLCGKPDYLLETDSFGRRLLVPMEIKPSRRSERLYESDRVQIGAYLVALRATISDHASPIGYVRYQSRTFEVALTTDLEREVRRLVAAVQNGRTLSVLHRSHNIAARCRGCPVRVHCDESLVS